MITGNTLSLLVGLSFGFLCSLRHVEDPQDTCTPMVTCTTTVFSTGTFSTSGTEQSGSCVCHYDGEETTGRCLTMECKVDLAVTPQWGVIGGASGKSTTGADQTTCQVAGTGIAESCKAKACATYSNELKWNAYSDTSCQTLSQIWQFKVFCASSGCSDGICQR